MNTALSETPEQVRTLTGGFLRSLREGAGRTLSEVSAEAGVSAAYLSEIERGRKEASVEVLIAVIYALGGDLASLYAELAAALGGERVAATWPADPRQQLRLASSTLDGESLRAVAQFSAFLATTGAPSPRRRIGFAVPGQR